MQKSKAALHGMERSLACKVGWYFFSLSTCKNVERVVNFNITQKVSWMPCPISLRISKGTPLFQWKRPEKSRHFSAIENSLLLMPSFLFFYYAGIPKVFNSIGLILYAALAKPTQIYEFMKSYIVFYASSHRQESFRTK